MEEEKVGDVSSSHTTVEASNKWNFSPDYEDCNMERKEAILADSEERTKQSKGTEAWVAEWEAKIEIEKLRTQQVLNSNETNIRLAKINRRTTEVVETTKTEREGLPNTFTRIMRMTIFYGFLGATIIYTPDFWPSVTRAVVSLLPTRQ